MTMQNGFSDDPTDAELMNARTGVCDVLNALGLRGIITDEEIDDAVIAEDSIFGHPLLLGVLMRLTRSNDEKLVRAWLIGLSAWKNTTVHPDLCGKTPQQSRVLRKIGEYERALMAQMVQDFERELQNDREFVSAPSRDVLQKRFVAFQDHYLDLYPVVNPFADSAGRSMSNREIIIEERRRAGVPEGKLLEIGITMSLGTDADEMGEKAARIESEYHDCCDELDTMRKKSPSFDEERVQTIYEKMRTFEPYMKGHEMNWAYYANLGFIAYELGEVVDAVTFLGRAITLNPKDEQSREILGAIKEVFDKEERRRTKKTKKARKKS